MFVQLALLRFTSLRVPGGERSKRRVRGSLILIHLPTSPHTGMHAKIVQSQPLPNAER
jgi:hypothetical protein